MLERLTPLGPAFMLAPMSDPWPLPQRLGSGPILLLMLLALATCTEPHGETAQFRVALLLAGPENDEGWNQAAYEGLERIRDELGAEVRKVRAAAPGEIQRSMERAAEDGFDLVIGHGFEFNEPAARLAPRFPQTAFVTTGGHEHADNLATIVLRMEEASYLLGVLAAHLSDSGIVSALSGERFEPVVRVVRGLRAGLQSVREDGKVLEEYLGSWEDSVLAKEKALAHADAGADLLFQNADAAGIGVFEAARARGLLAFGCNRDQSGKAPDVILASAVGDIPGTLLDLAREALGGEFTGGERSMGMREGRVWVVVHPGFEDRLPPSVQAAMDQAKAAIVEGSLRPGEL